VELKIDRTIWSAPNREPIAGGVKLVTLGWVLKGERRVPFAGELVVGATYLLPLARIDGNLADASAGFPLRIMDSSSAAPVEPFPWMKELAGSNLDSVQTQLASLQPDPRAASFAHLEGGARARAVREVSR